MDMSDTGFEVSDAVENDLGFDIYREDVRRLREQVDQYPERVIWMKNASKRERRVRVTGLTLSTLSLSRKNFILDTDESDEEPKECLRNIVYRVRARRRYS